MNSAQPSILILACGNTLRSDDGVGPHLAEWAAQHFSSDARIRPVLRQQWTPDLAQDIAAAQAVLFIDCTLETAPGVVQLTHVQPTPSSDPGKHHLDAASLLGLANELYCAAPNNALQLTIGAGSTELGEQFSAEVHAAIPHARSLLELTVLQLLDAELSARSSPA